MKPSVRSWVVCAVEQVVLWRKDGRKDPLILYSGRKWQTEERMDVLKNSYVQPEENIDMVKTQARKGSKNVPQYFVVITLKNPEEFMDMLIGEMGEEQAELTLRQAHAILEEGESKCRK